MSPIQRIRKQVFKLTQKEFADAISVAQPTVSRWESGVPIAQPEMAAIREQAKRRGLPWDDSWFFDDIEEHDGAFPASTVPAGKDATSPRTRHVNESAAPLPAGSAR